MNFLAAATESVSHPATMLVVGALLAAVLKGRASSIAMVAAPLLGLSFVIGLEPGSFSTVSLFGLEIKSVAVDKQAKLFGYLFHACSPDRRDLLLSFTRPLASFDGTVVRRFRSGGCLCRRYALPFLWWEALALTSVFQIWARRTKESEESGFRYLFFHVSSGLLLLAGIIIRYHGEGETAFSLVPLTQELEAGDTGALMILLAIGIKAAFPGLHAWLKDGYAEATPTGPVWLWRFYHKVAVCMLARLFPGAEVLIVIGGSWRCFPFFMP